MSISAMDVRADSLLSIGGLAALTGVSPRSLRYYEEQGLLSARRTPAGHRRYDHEAVDRVVLVQRLFAAGLTSTEIRPVLPGMVAEEHRTGALVSALRGYRDRLQQEVARQLDTIDILDEVIDEQDRA
ncbi:MerR family transcriptional regulator [Brachybacterium fresconis]|uniref:DNA-binding transcriptional MerR regulator n=1 Tax=Brachybacterium fresconis TaxID=173363 RepID=A0ABS4YLM4_9MICO|nr:MerR family transcriptional regulator [Brachybacterium fresconis]MBP2409649.1 DNA-binding transcriptional MerR regulator [Brachybacterium fresconis]